MRIIEVPLEERSYPIYIGHEMWSSLSAVLKQRLTAKKALLISDENVFPLYGAKTAAALKEAGFSVSSAVVPAGEESKSLAQAESLYTKAIEARLSRQDVVVALGGGVIGDLAGFIAATYLRGVSFVQIPTSLLAQVDSSVGGKVAVNHALGKNLIGTFYQPRLVWIDLAVLDTLPRREFLAGAAEVVKYGIISSEPLFQTLEKRWDDFLAKDLEVLGEVIATCCNVKAEIVRQDEKEKGIRALLNFGHTLGHALETATNYTYYLHGEAVLVGMVLAVHLAVSEELIDLQTAGRMLALLKGGGLKKAPSDLTVEQVLTAMQQDKKRQADKIVFVLPVQIGSGQTYTTLSEHEITEIVKKYLRWPESLLQIDYII
ncbi:MAG: 3-dehydroquinate synthase [Firmicutes bacterium]|nr:3-dehydroquinate synthase [Bacillota bacterium]